MAQDKKLEKIKSSVFARGLTLARLTMNTGAGLASHRVSTLFSSEEKRSDDWKSFLTGQAFTLAQELGELKGSLMKAGQMLSMYGEHFLPPEANQLLKSLQADSPPLAWKVIDEQLRKEIKPELLEELEIDQEPIGSASLGQVHRAKIKATGKEIVLKVQYPGVERAIESDLKALKSMFNLMKFLPRGKVTDQIFDEVKVMLVQEMNYELEADATEAYRERLNGDTRYIVPEIQRRYSSGRVLASSFERGIRADDNLVRNLHPERRHKLALNFLDLYLKELFDWGIVQTDPHLGNYQVRLSPTGDDQLILFDFGAVRTYPESFLGPYRDMIHAAVFGDKAKLAEAATKLHFLEDADHPDLRQIFEDFCMMTVEPFLLPDDPRNTKGQISANGEYDWKNTDLPQRLTQKVIQMVRRYELRPPPREILFLDRKTGGVFVFMAVMGSKVKARDLLLKYIERKR